jgi:protein-tyrosine-phosphatase
MDLSMKKVLFICVENSCRSQMAEGFFRHHCPEHMTAYSAGSMPSGKVHSRAISLMRERGLDLSGHASKRIDDFPDVVFDLAVTMGCGDVCPEGKAKEHREWDIPDPKNLDDEQFRQVRDAIEIKVGELIQDLRAEVC